MKGSLFASIAACVMILLAPGAFLTRTLATSDIALLNKAVQAVDNALLGAT